MPITRLHHSGSIESGATISLDKSASFHLIKVMRAKKNTHVILFNGDGFEYTATLLDENIKSCAVIIKDKVPVQRESHLSITLIQGISRNDRMDTCIQKSIELGANTIIPVICERSTTKLKDKRADKKLKHWTKIIVSACEQSGRCVLPQLQPITTYLNAARTARSGCKIVLDPQSTTGLKDIKIPDKEIYILVGPEGGLTQAEIALAYEMDFKGIHLGPRILRTETSGPACIASLQALWGDF